MRNRKIRAIEKYAKLKYPQYRWIVSLPLDLDNDPFVYLYSHATTPHYGIHRISIDTINKNNAVKHFIDEAAITLREHCDNRA